MGFDATSEEDSFKFDRTVNKPTIGGVARTTVNK